MKKLSILFAFSLVIGLAFEAGTAEADAPETLFVDCPVDSIQEEVNEADGPTTIFVTGTCVENVSITKDDITLSGNQAGDLCNKASPGGTGTIIGTITVKGARARIEFLTLTGPGPGVFIKDRAVAELDCNDIVDNQGTGIVVRRSSHALVTNNKARGNGSCGLYVVSVSSVESLGNTYEDNQYCAIEADRQSEFRSGAGLARGSPAVLAERDIIVARGCDFESGVGCFTFGQDRVAVEVFNGGLVELRNTSVGGKIEATAQSSFRVDGNAEVKGNIRVEFNSIARLRSRDQVDHTVTYTGTMTCDSSSLAWNSEVQCGQMCSGAIPVNCSP